MKRLREILGFPTGEGPERDPRPDTEEDSRVAVARNWAYPRVEGFLSDKKVDWDRARREAADRSFYTSNEDLAFYIAQAARSLEGTDLQAMAALVCLMRDRNLLPDRPRGSR